MAKGKSSKSKAKRAVKDVKRIKKAIKAKVKRVVKAAVRKAVRKAVSRVLRPAKTFQRAVTQVKRVALPVVNRALAPAGLSLVQSKNKQLVGSISHFFDKISVAVVEATGSLKVGDKISIEGPQTNFTQTVGSIQVEHKPAMELRKGQSAGMKVAKEVRKKDLVYKLL